MNRSVLIDRLSEPEFWDVLVIGGGATGLGVAVDASSRGYRTALVEQSDFGKGTSSRSTKLIHGGVRYLQQGNVSLVIESLRERGLLMQNAPHLVHDLPFIVPNYDWWEGPFYGVGLKVYDILAGDLGLGPSKHLSLVETLERIPTLEPEGLRGGVIYYDGQFDDARLAINLAQTAYDLGAAVVNYVRVVDLRREGGIVSGVCAVDEETGNEIEIFARVVVNATGVFSDSILKMDDEGARPIIQPSQGSHVVLQRSFLPGDHAIMVPRTDDGRVLFAVPWHDRVIVGTTDVAVTEPELEPIPTGEEIDFLLEHAARYLTKDPTRSDVLSVFAGHRPLVRTGDDRGTAALSRDHVVMVSVSGLVTIVGGKWTTYRKMAQDTVDQAVIVAGLKEKPSETHTLRLHGWLVHADESEGSLGFYGSDAPALRSLLSEREEWNDLLHPKLPYRVGEIIWAARHEMARTVEDVLSRRTRALLLDARAAVATASTVAELLAEELDRPAGWADRQVAAFNVLARGYLVS
ncbi:MAG: glycerol-3-phosphate dehydrogenase/oxidase [Bacteroidetes bacterium]|nr:glycerol-3-phosphate dehydrogenase/oxidase [Bacteroidota bacterium]